MSRRLSLADIADRIKSQIPRTLGVYRVGSSLEADYLHAVGDSAQWPAVWVGAQRSTPIEEGSGFTGIVKQMVKVEIAIRVICARYVAGERDEEDKLNRIADGVVDVLFGWKPTNAASHLVWVQSVDGQPEQSAMTIDLIFSTKVAYSKALRS